MFFHGLEFSKTRISSLLFMSTILCAVLITMIPSLYLCWEQRLPGLEILEYKNAACWTYTITMIFSFCSFMTVTMSSYGTLLYVYTVNRFWPPNIRECFFNINVAMLLGVISLFIALIAKTVAALGLAHDFNVIIGIFTFLAIVSFVIIFKILMLNDDPKYDNGKTIAEVIKDHSETLPFKEE